MKKITIILIALILALPVLLQAQYSGGNGRGDVMLELLSSPLTNTGNNNITTSESYSLSQNYPNPFNPTTNIKFDVAKFSNVKIIVFDIMGREVQTLVNESVKPGTYETSFDGSSLASGVYFYKLITSGFTETKRMLMIK
ncbi:MAG: T9SS type A sorting domain-containing protein [Ignavibacteriota bacterium]|nr:T9SS type A sorting domain-containing protein [Ignavibacteriota bacterium]